MCPPRTISSSPRWQGAKAGRICCQFTWQHPDCPHKLPHKRKGCSTSLSSAYLLKWDYKKKSSKSLLILKHKSRLLKGTRILIHQDKMVFPSTGHLAGALLFHMSQLSSSRLTVAYPSLLPSSSNAKQEWAASTTGAGLSCQHQAKPTSLLFPKW